MMAAAAVGEATAEAAAVTVNKRKSIPVRGGGRPYGCERLRLLHSLDSWFTDGSEVVSLTPWLPYMHRKTAGTHIC
jgi:hypothetical protein